jgi:hydrogenase nickel incorporation protein HypB
MNSRIIDVRRGVLDKNTQLALDLRQRFLAAGLYVVNLLSSPGTGKTALLEQTLTLLRTQDTPGAALTGDLETDNDARRLARSGAPVRQIRTHGNCHLEAEMVAAHLAGWDLTGMQYLFIENVGNLVCPASYDLGEMARVVLLSVTEGEDKPLKYPPAFASADRVLLTKMDLGAAVEFDRDQALANIQSVHPGVPVLETSARTGAGIDAWLAWLAQRRVADHTETPDLPVATVQE